MSNVFNPGAQGGSGANYVNRVAAVTVAYPIVALGSKAVSVPVPGVKLGDSVSASLNNANALAVGLVIAGCRPTADGTVEVTFATPLVSLSAGSVKLDFLVMGTR